MEPGYDTVFQNDVAGLFFCGLLQVLGALKSDIFDMMRMWTCLPWKDAVQKGHISCLGVPGSCVEGDELQPAPVGKATGGQESRWLFSKVRLTPKRFI